MVNISLCTLVDYIGKDSNSNGENIVESVQPQVIKLYGWKGVVTDFAIIR